MKTNTRGLLGLIVLFAWSTAATAASPSDPQQMMSATTDRVLQRLEQEPQLRKDNGKLIDLIEAEVFPLVDFPHAAKLTLGQAWPKASAEQQQRFIGEMQKLLACTYAAAFANYAGQKVEYLEPRWSEARDHVEIRSRIEESGKPPIPVNYRLHQDQADWKLYDLVVEGVSLVANYRATFRQKLRDQDLDALIQDLAARSDRDCQGEA